MRFKQKATERALYKLLKLASNVLTIFAVFSIILASVLMVSGITLLATQSEGGASSLGSGVGTFITAGILIYVQISLLEIRADMVERTDSEVE